MSPSQRLAPFGVTIFTEITDLAVRHGAINLGQGFPDWDGPDFAKRAAARSMSEGGADQYPPSPGIPELRQAVAGRYGPLLGRELDPATEVTVTAGCTEGLAASFLGLVDPDDEVVIVQPFYDSYPVNVSLAGARARYVTLRPPEFRLDSDELRSVFSPRTRAVVVNTPHNPTGRVLDSEELGEIARLCVEYDAIAICDEVYEEMVYEGRHIRLATLPGMWERTLTLSSVGKTYSLTGWKVGWVIAPPELTAGVRSAHQYLTFTTPTPVQHGAAAALEAPADYYRDLLAGYRERRDVLVEGLSGVGFEVHRPAGTYFLMAGYSPFSDEDDQAFARRLVEEAGVAVVPPSAFYRDGGVGSGMEEGVRSEIDGGAGSRMIRLAFCKSRAQLEEAVGRLEKALVTP